MRHRRLNADVNDLAGRNALLAAQVAAAELSVEQQIEDVLLEHADLDGDATEAAVDALADLVENLAVERAAEALRSILLRVDCETPELVALRLVALGGESESIREAAKSCGCSLATFWRRVKAMREAIFETPATKV